MTTEYDGAVIAGHIPGGDPAVLRHASALAVATGAPLIVAHIDTSRVIDAPDPDDAAPGTAISEALRRGRRDLAVVRAEADLALKDSPARWSVLQRVGDPAMALHDLAERTHASMFVIGTRRDQIGAAVREFLNGSVALRLAPPPVAPRRHRPHRSRPSLADPHPDVTDCGAVALSACCRHDRSARRRR